MKKLLLSLITLLCLACSTDENLNNIDSSDINGITVETITTEKETYKGVFATANGQDRGTLEVIIADDKQSATAYLTLSSGDITFIDTDNITDLGGVKELSFTSNELSFIMSTEEEGVTSAIDNVNFRGQESAILVARHTERAPATPITGTYICTTNCVSPLDNTATQTLNFVFTTADGVSAVATQTTLDSTVFMGIGQQTTCVPSGTETTCTIASGDGMTTTGYVAGGGIVTWAGTHRFNNEATGPNDCSTAFGTWSWDSPILGTISGTFVSDASCPLVYTPATAATSTAAAAFGTSLDNAINGAGLVTPNSLTSNHVGTGPTDSFVFTGTTNTLDFELGATYRIRGLSFWNQNGGGPSTDVGINQVVISSSTDGMTFIPIPGAPTSFSEVITNESAPETFTFDGIDASHIRVEVLSNHGNASNTGFAEIAFARL